jgi:anti-sigma B factor antagonist
MSPGLEASWKQLDHGIALVSLAGELDLAATESLAAPFTTALRDSSLIVDLGGVEFIDSAGLRILVSGRREAQAAGRGFAVVGSAAHAVASVIELTRASSQIPLFASLDAAQASLQHA